MVAVLLHASLAVNVLVCERLQVELEMVPSDEVIVGVAVHASVADAVPNAAVISEAAGLHPNETVE